MSLSFAANFGSVEAAPVGALRGCVAPNAGSRQPLSPASDRSSGLHRPVAGRASDRTPLHDGGGKRLLAGLARLVAGEPVDTLGHESRLPSPDHGLRFAGAAHDLSGTAALGRRQDDVGAPYMLLRRAAVRDDRLESTAIR